LLVAAGGAPDERDIEPQNHNAPSPSHRSRSRADRLTSQAVGVRRSARAHSDMGARPVVVLTGRLRSELGADDVADERGTVPSSPVLPRQLKGRQGALSGAEVVVGHRRSGPGSSRLRRSVRHHRLKVSHPPSRIGMGTGQDG